MFLHLQRDSWGDSTGPIAGGFWIYYSILFSLWGLFVGIVIWSFCFCFCLQLVSHCLGGLEFHLVFWFNGLVLLVTSAVIVGN